jgi:4-hydroxy-3-polyprenylbenzoate decarboxylase
MRVFLGVTGASGAPYAERLVRALAAVDCEIGLSASRSGIEVLATELYGDPTLPREEVLERFIGGAVEQVTVYGENDFSSPYASGSARVGAYVICPCSMATVGTLATGAMQNLIHRAASVALKERRKLVLVPRETPLSSIHLRGLATLNEAGAVILFAAPGFYHGPTSIDDLVDFVVARCLDQIGIDNALAKRWGEQS